MLKLPLRLRALSSPPGSTMLASSFSSSSSSSILGLRNKNPSSLFFSSSRHFSNGALGNRVVFSSHFPRAVSLRCFASSTGFDRVQVQNPIVEMDGKNGAKWERFGIIFSACFIFIFLFNFSIVELLNYCFLFCFSDN